MREKIDIRAKDLAVGFSLLKGSVSRFLLFAANVVSGLFMMPYLIQNLGKSEYGLWVLAGSIISFYSLLDMGVFRAMHRFLMQAIYKGEPDAIKSSLATNIVLGLCIGGVSLFITIGVVLSADRIVSDESLVEDFVAVILLLGVKTSLEFPMYAFFGVLMARYKFYVIGNIQLVALAVRVAIIVVLVENGFGILGLAFASVTTLLVSNLWVVWLASKELGMGAPKLREFRLSMFKEYVSFGKFTYAIAVSKKISESLDTIVVNLLFGLVSVTHYAVAASLVQYFTSVISSIFGVFSSLLNKYVANDNSVSLRGTFLLLTELTCLVSAYIGGGMILLGEEFINAWMGVGFYDSYNVLLILVVPAVLSGAQFVSLETLIAKGSHQKQAYVSVVEVILNVFLSIYLGSMFGVVGVAFATLLSISVNSLFILPIHACKIMGIDVFYYYRIHMKVYASSVGAFLFVYAIKVGYGVEGFVDLIAIGAVYTVVSFVVYYILFMSSDLKNIFRVYLKESVIARLS